MDTPPSKSARKRETVALQELGERLIGLPEAQLRSMGLNDRLVDALIAAAGIKAHGALRRQRQLIGKLMRHEDPEPIRRRLEALEGTGRAAKADFKRAEKWRDALVAEGQPALARFVEATGRPNPDLEALLDELRHASDLVRRRSISRRIFRAVSDALGSRVQDGCA